MKPIPKDLHLTGIQKICRSFGAVKVNGKTMVWDYKKESAVPQSDLPDGSKSWRENEIEKYKQL